MSGEVRTCPDCFGTGGVMGTGSLRIRPDGSATIESPRTCPTCEGTGRVRIEPWREQEQPTQMNFPGSKGKFYRHRWPPDGSGPYGMEEIGPYGMEEIGPYGMEEIEEAEKPEERT